MLDLFTSPATAGLFFVHFRLRKHRIRAATMDGQQEAEVVELKKSPA